MFKFYSRCLAGLGCLAISCLRCVLTPDYAEGNSLFTGIVEELGSIASRDGSALVVNGRTVLEDVELGSSIAVNGCCLTVVEWDTAGGWFRVDVSQETYDRTQLGDLRGGDPVNLERPVRLADRLGGHLVQGHVDAVGEIVQSVPDLVVKIPTELRRYIVQKGSVTVDGISLTVVDPQQETFGVAVIPHTSEVTTLGRKGPGDRVNLEVDVMAKYAEQLLSGYVGQAAATTSQPLTGSTGTSL